MRNIKSKILNGITKCSMCGRKVWIQGFDEKSRITRLIDKYHVCYDCAYWTQLIDYPPEHFEIIGDTAFRILPFVENPDKNNILGGGGKTQYFLRPDGNTLKSNDVWKIGKIPVRFQQQLPPTLWIVTQKFYHSLNKHPRTCFATNCMDRYHCYRYDYRMEFTNESCSHVPKEWVVGDEHCRYYLPLLDIQGFAYADPSDILDESSEKINKQEK